MAESIRNLAPASLWNHFADLNAVPRASKKEEKVIQFMLDFGLRLGLETKSDRVGNVIIRKPATPGMQTRKSVVLQSHLDMVHQKNEDTPFDFDTEGIDMLIDGDWVRARGTTLGADNGIGVATIMAILEAGDIAHPAIEALFTIDEETGMTGAMGLEGGVLNGDILLNLDTEEDSEIDIGCAGGLDVTAVKSYQPEVIDDSQYDGLKISIKGLKGGHSGIDIHRGRGNANKMIVRILYGLINDYGVRISVLNGGSLRNAIPREASAIIALPKIKRNEALTEINKRIQFLISEYKSIEPNVDISAESIVCPSVCLPESAQKETLQSIYAAHNGVFRMSPDIDDLVEASNNVAKVEISDGNIKVLCLTRSSVESSKTDVANALICAFEPGGFEVTLSGEYPGWKPDVKSQILGVLTSLYEKMHGAKASVVACHAGLECGIIGKNYPFMDMISYGPTIKGAHSPDEKVNIRSVQKFWNFTLEILNNIPLKDS